MVGAAERLFQKELDSSILVLWKTRGLQKRNEEEREIANSKPIAG